MEGDPSNEERKAAALEALSVEKYQGQRAITDPDDIVDLVTDLLHLARSLDIEPDYVLECAKINLDAEEWEEHEAEVLQRLEEGKNGS